MLWSAIVMNARVIVAVVGVVTLLLGIAGLVYPEEVMRFVGYAYPNPPNLPGTRGEVRALYGGLMIAAGVLTLLAVPSPQANQGRLLLLGLLWLGAGGGRVFGVFMDGNPGLIGWLSVVAELGGGGALLFASQFAARSVPTAPGGSEAPPFRA